MRELLRGQENYCCRPQNGSHHGRSRFGTPGRVTLNGPQTRSNRATGELHRPCVAGSGRAKIPMPAERVLERFPQALDALTSGQITTARRSRQTPSEQAPRDSRNSHHQPVRTLDQVGVRERSQQADFPVWHKGDADMLRWFVQKFFTATVCP